METVWVWIQENGLVGLLNRCDFDPAKHIEVDGPNGVPTGVGVPSQPKVESDGEQAAELAEPVTGDAAEPRPRKAKR